jgi:hypothetical protein
MENGLYSFHMHMLDGMMGRDSGILILRDGSFLGGGPVSGRPAPIHAATAPGRGSCTPTSIHRCRSLHPHTLGGQEVTSGFFGTFAGDQAEAFGTSLIGTRGLSFRATLKRLADN